VGHGLAGSVMGSAKKDPYLDGGGEEYHHYNIQPFSKALADYFIHMLVHHQLRALLGVFGIFDKKRKIPSLLLMKFTNSILQTSVSLYEI